MGLAMVLSWAGWSPAEQPRDYLAELVSMRAKFVQEVRESEDAEEMTASALVYAGRAWAAAGLRLSERYGRHDIKAELIRVEKEHLETIAESRRPESRQVAAAGLFYHSLKVVALILSEADRDKLTRLELKTIDEHIARTLGPKPGRAKDLIILTNGCLTMLSLAIRSVDKGLRFEDKVNQELQKRVTRAKAIRRRKDVHSLGRLFMMALNNFKGCFNLIYIFNLAWDERLYAEIGPLRKAWEKHTGNDAPPAKSMVVTVTALTEASFPITMTIAKH